MPGIPPMKVWIGSRDSKHLAFTCSRHRDFVEGPLTPNKSNPQIKAQSQDDGSCVPTRVGGRNNWHEACGTATVARVYTFNFFTGDHDSTCRRLICISTTGTRPVSFLGRLDLNRE